MHTARSCLCHSILNGRDAKRLKLCCFDGNGIGVRWRFCAVKASSISSATSAMKCRIKKKGKRVAGAPSFSCGVHRRRNFAFRIRQGCTHVMCVRAQSTRRNNEYRLHVTATQARTRIQIVRQRRRSGAANERSTKM